ncbi:MAG: efflux RND transporter permease subunit [Pseudomonadota bacterium]
MRYLTRWFIHNPVAANLSMALILFLGVMTVLTIRIEGFPRIPPESITVTTTYPNATTAQVDELVTQKLEKALEGLAGVRSISSQSSDEYSLITVRRAGGKDLQELLDKVRLRIDAVSDLPSGIRQPVIQDTGYDFPALYVNLSGQTDPLTLQKLAERLREELLAQPEISRMNVWGLFERELSINVEPQKLQRFDLTINDVVEKIQASSLNFQSGTLRTGGGAIRLRADNRAKFVAEYKNIPIIESSDGTSIKLEDLASIQDGFKEGEYLFRFNAVPTAGMEVLIGQKDNILEVSQAVHSVVSSFERQLPSNIEITIWGDSSNYIADRLNMLGNNGIQGLLLVILVLSMFLNVRLAFWVAMGIPVSVMGALAVAGSSWVDYSLNDVTTFGLIIVLGILVDDAVVVGESVFEERRANASDPLESTEQGVEKVAVATVFGVLTTIAAFFPMLLLDNPLGKVLAGFSGIVILALIFSLIESKLILPAHLARTNIDTPPRYLISRIWTRIQTACRNWLNRVRNQFYAPMLRNSLRHRYATLILFIAIGLFGLGLTAYGKIKTVFFPDVPGQIITINLEMDARAPFQLTKSNLERIQAIGDKLSSDLKSRHSLEIEPVRSMFLVITDPSSAQLYAELTPVADRPGIGIWDILYEWQWFTGRVEGSNKLQFSAYDELGGGFQIRLFSKDADLLKKASEDLRVFLGRINGVSNIRDTLTAGQPELEIRVKPQARNLGFDTATLASQIGNAFGGVEVQKISRTGNEVRVVVQNQRTARDTIDDLNKTWLRSRNGEWIPFQSVAEVRGDYVSGYVHRQNGKRVNTMAASINRGTVAPEEVWQSVTQDLSPLLAEKYPSVKLQPAGELEEIGEIQGGMLEALLLAAVLIYVLMAVPLKSYWQPFVILAIVPFGFIGAAFGHLLMGLPLSVLSFFGMLALTGVVINDSLVLITRYNQARDSGLSVTDALHDAGMGRFRAIFLTTVTTVVGLSPLLLETSEQAQYLIPAAVSLAFGELFATALMLILVPVLIAITEDVKSFNQPAAGKANVSTAG